MIQKHISVDATSSEHKMDSFQRSKIGQDSTVQAPQTVKHGILNAVSLNREIPIPTEKDIISLPLPYFTFWSTALDYATTHTKYSYSGISSQGNILLKFFSLSSVIIDSYSIVIINSGCKLPSRQSRYLAQFVGRLQHAIIVVAHKANYRVYIADECQKGLL